MSSGSGGGGLVDFLVDRHGGPYRLPDEFDGDSTEFYRRYPTRRRRAAFAEPARVELRVVDAHDSAPVA